MRRVRVCRYIDLDPVRARMFAYPVSWEWYSYAALTSLAPMRWSRRILGAGLDDASCIDGQDGAPRR
jgi:hypothetical protein